MVSPSPPRRGSRLSMFNAQPEDIPPLSTFESAFQLQEYITLLVRLNPHEVQRIVTLPEGADEACWIYEHLRRLAQDLGCPLVTILQKECSRQTCPEMKAGEWLYLCVAHGNGSAMEQCCAIDYVVHTLDSATAVLNSQRVFPSRLSVPQTSHRQFSSLARRLGRIFAHAWFHHRDAFFAAEAENALYARFLALSMTFNLVPSEFLVIPTTNEEGEEEGEVDEYDRGQTQMQAADDERRPGRTRTDTMIFTDAPNAISHISPTVDATDDPVPEEIKDEHIDDAREVAASEGHLLLESRETTTNEAVKETSPELVPTASVVQQSMVTQGGSEKVRQDPQLLEEIGQKTD